MSILKEICHQFHILFRQKSEQEIPLYIIIILFNETDMSVFISIEDVGFQCVI